MQNKQQNIDNSQISSTVLITMIHTVDINSSEKSVNKSLEGFGEVSVGLSYAMILKSLLKLISGHFTVLQRVA
jgi:hypothetical protein